MSTRRERRRQRPTRLRPSRVHTHLHRPPRRTRSRSRTQAWSRVTTFRQSTDTLLLSPSSLLPILRCQVTRVQKTLMMSLTMEEGWLRTRTMTNPETKSRLIRKRICRRLVESWMLTVFYCDQKVSVWVIHLTKVNVAILIILSCPAVQKWSE